MIPWLRCRLDGCNYGLRDTHDQGFLRKQWAIQTNDELFHRVFRSKVCPQAITRHWRDQQVPRKHLNLLDSPTNVADYEIDEDETQILSHDALMLDETFFSDEADNIKLSETLEDNLVSVTDQVILANAFRAARVKKEFSWDRLCDLLQRLQEGMKSQATQRGRWSSGDNTFRCTLVLGNFVHGNFTGITSNTYKYVEVTKYVNEYLQTRIGSDWTWSSVMISFNTPTTVHKDNHNLYGSMDPPTWCMVLARIMEEDSGYRGNRHLGDRKSAGGCPVEAMPRGTCYPPRTRLSSSNLICASCD